MNVILSKNIKTNTKNKRLKSFIRTSVLERCSFGMLLKRTYSHLLANCSFGVPSELFTRAKKDFKNMSETEVSIYKPVILSVDRETIK